MELRKKVKSLQEGCIGQYVLCIYCGESLRLGCKSVTGLSLQLFQISLDLLNSFTHFVSYITCHLYVFQIMCPVWAKLLEVSY